MNVRAHLAGFVLSIGFLFGGASVDASPGVETSFLDEKARELFARGKYNSALAKFLEVQRATPSAQGAYNIAVCAERAKNQRLAYEFLVEYLRLAPEDHSFRKDAEKRRGELEKSLALVRVESKPPGAKIYVDRVALGDYGVTPRVIVVGKGEHQVIVQAENYSSSTTKTVAARGALVAVSAVLTHLTGQLDIRTNVMATEIEARNLDWEQDLQPGKNEVPSGLLVLTASAPGYQTLREELVLAPGDARSVSLLLKKRRPATGKLLVDTQGPSAKVYIDGAFRAQTPATIPRLAVGKHDILVEAKGFLSWKGRLRIEKGKTSFERVVLQPGKGK